MIKLSFSLLDLSFELKSMSAESTPNGNGSAIACVLVAHNQDIVHLHIKFIDEKNKLNITEDLGAPCQINIQQMIWDFINISGLDHLHPHDIRLARIILDKAEINIDPNDPRKVLDEFEVNDGDTIIFEPTHDLPPPNTTYLTVISPDDNERIPYQWCKSTTTLAMLRHFVIEQFSLQDVDISRIHLSTYLRELPVTLYPDRLLINFHVATGIHVHVNVVGSLNSTNQPINSMIRIECIYDNDKALIVKIPAKETIDSLRREIEQKLQSTIFDLTLLSQAKGELDTSDLKRSFESFGIEETDTIFVHFARKSGKTVASNNSSQQSKTPSADEKITVVLKWQRIFQLQIPMPLSTTINDLTRLEAKILKERVFPVSIQTKTGYLNMKETNRTLLDCGVKAGEVVHVNVTEVNSANSSIVANEIDLSQLKSRRIDPDYLLPLGLRNLGNTCYMNSAFQCLARVLPFSEFFIKNLKLGIENEQKNPQANWNPFEKIGILIGNYANLIWNLLRYNEENDCVDSIEAVNMKHIISNYDHHYRANHQQDAQEFISFLLQTIHRELKDYCRNEKNTLIKQLFYGEMQSTVTCTSCHHEESTCTPISILSLPLQVQERRFFIRFYTRRGKEESHDVVVSVDGRIKDVVWAFVNKIEDEQLYCFTLVVIDSQEVDFEKTLKDLPDSEITIFEQEKANQKERQKNNHDQPIYTLDQCFADFLSAESLENQWICPKENCRRKDLAKKQLKFTRLPPVIIIHFKRFAHTNGNHLKVETHVDYPMEGLDLSNLVPRSTEETTYDLVAVCNHTGFIFNGHYTATTRCETNGKIEWFHFDDARVTRICDRHYLHDIVTRDAYLLFYVRRDLLKSEVQQYATES
jgi:ubiquitin C-terminal hydrolase